MVSTSDLDECPGVGAGVGWTGVSAACEPGALTLEETVSASIVTGKVFFDNELLTRDLLTGYVFISCDFE